MEAHYLDFLSKNFGKREKFIIVLKKKITESLLSSYGELYTFSKVLLFRLLVLVVRDSVITLNAIAYYVNNNLDEVLLAIVCSGYYGNIVRVVPKVAFTELLLLLAHVYCIVLY